MMRKVEPVEIGQILVPVVRVADHHHHVVVVPLLELERPGADRLAVVLLALLGHRLGRGDHARAVGEDQRQRGVGPAQAQRHLVRRQHLHRVDRFQLALHRRARIGPGAVEMRLHRRRVEGLAVMELHALAQGEDQGLGIGELPGGRKARLGCQRRRLEIDQRVVQRIEQHVVGAGAARQRIERRRVERRGDLQDAALLGRLGEGRRSGEGERQRRTRQRAEPEKGVATRDHGDSSISMGVRRPGFALGRPVQSARKIPFSFGLPSRFGT